jgi:hypothetical protein
MQEGITFKPLWGRTDARSTLDSLLLCMRVQESASKGPGLAAVIAAATKQMRAEWATPRSLESQFGRTIFIHNLKTARSPPESVPEHAQRSEGGRNARVTFGVPVKSDTRSF